MCEVLLNLREWTEREQKERKPSDLQNWRFHLAVFRATVRRLRVGKDVLERAAEKSFKEEDLRDVS